MFDLLIRLIRETGRFFEFGVARGFRGEREGAPASERLATWIGAWVWVVALVLAIWVLSLI